MAEVTVQIPADQMDTFMYQARSTLRYAQDRLADINGDVAPLNEIAEEAARVSRAAALVGTVDGMSHEGGTVQGDGEIILAAVDGALHYRAECVKSCADDMPFKFQSDRMDPEIVEDLREQLQAVETWLTLREQVEREIHAAAVTA